MASKAMWRSNQKHPYDLKIAVPYANGAFVALIAGLSIHKESWGFLGKRFQVRLNDNT